MNTDKNTDKKKPTPHPSQRHEGARYETCRECGHKWNVSKQKKIPPSGYLCPKCWGKNKKRPKEGLA